MWGPETSFGNKKCVCSIFIIKLCSYSDIPPDIDAYTISIYNKGKRSKDTEVGKFGQMFFFCEEILSRVDCQYNCLMKGTVSVRQMYINSL